MKRVLPLFVLTVLLLASGALADLSQRIEQVVRSTDLGAATVAVSVRDADSGAALTNLDAETMMIPASNMKLLTTGAALHSLRPDFRFSTRLLLDDDRLIVLGDGDPAFGDPHLLARMGRDGVALDVESFLELWVRPIVETGITDLSAIVVDDRIFDREFVHPTWPRDQLNRRYCAQVSGVSFHANVLHFFPRPQPGGRPSLLNFTPRATWLEPKNRATSDVSVQGKDSVWIARKLGTNVLTVYGNVRHSYRTPVPVTMHDTPAFFGRLLAARLRSAGITVGEVRVSAADAPDSIGDLVGPPVVTPLTTVVTRCNRDSQNLYAEALLKRIGHERTGRPGSWLNGASIVRHVLHEHMDADLATRVIIADGSGLSRANRVAPATMTEWLHALYTDDDLAAPFIESLAVGGESGTLRKRMRTVDLHGAIVRAKSGYINGVSCLSGYVTIPNAGTRCFSVMVNDLRVPVGKAKKMQDQIVAAIARDLALRVRVEALGGE